MPPMTGSGKQMRDALATAYARKCEMARRKKLWRGGYAKGGDVAPDRQDDDLEVTEHDNTSGEPHTDGLDEIKHPMEFMADGGVVEDEEEMARAGESTWDVMPGETQNPFDFKRALQRRQRRFAG